MLLHDAVRHARTELKLSQKKLSEMAGIQRRQLSTLEKGGNVTLSTLRKVIAQLPNLESFTIDAVRTDVTRAPADIEDAYLGETMRMISSAMEKLADSILSGRRPSADEIEALRQINYRIFVPEKTPEEVDEMTAELTEELKPGDNVIQAWLRLLDRGRARRKRTGAKVRGKRR